MHQAKRLKHAQKSFETELFEVKNVTILCHKFRFWKHKRNMHKK